VRRILHSLLILLALTAPASARVWLVKPDGTGSAPTIQAGIDSAGVGDTILAAPGTYRGDGNRDIDFRGKAVLLISQRSFDSATTDSSVIDCEGTYETQHRGFYFHSGESRSAVLDGFVITNAYVDGSMGTPAAAGGGILCDSLSSPTIRFNTIRSCWAMWGGSGIFCESSSPTIQSNAISGGGSGCLQEAVDRAPLAPGNWGAYYGGGGIGAHLSSAVIRDNTILDNQASCGRGVPGGGISCIEGDSVVIIDNEIRGNASRMGAGVYLYSCTATVEGNNISSNGAGDGKGGAIYAENSVLVVANNKMLSNFAFLSGAALACQACTVLATGNEVADNHYIALSLNSSAVELSSNYIHDNNGTCVLDASLASRIKGNLIIHNSGAHQGAVLSCLASSPMIESNTIFGNSTGSGPVVYIDAQSAPVIEGNIIANDSSRAGAPGDGGGIYCESSTATFACNDVYGNEGGDYIGIPDQTGLNGNLSLDPSFCNASGGDFKLRGDSPCLPGNHPGSGDCGIMGAFGMGCPVATFLRDFGVELAGRFIVVRWKLAEAPTSAEFFVLRAEGKGADFAAVAHPAIERSGTSFSFKDSSCRPGTAYRYRVGVSDAAGPTVLFETEAITTPATRLALYQNYPNPFNPVTSISYFLPAKARVYVEIYDASGALVRRLTGADQEAGVHTVVWNGLDNRGSRAASGVYFCRLTTGEEFISRKMILVR
jgi:hypothetical protein